MAASERLQPYKSGSGGLKNPLYLLKEINNADKHRLIQVVGGRWAAGPVIVGSLGDGNEDTFFDRSRHRRILKDGAIFGEYTDHIPVQTKIFPMVAFSDGCRPVRGKHVVNTLSIISKQVAEIVESFAPELADLAI